PTGRATRPSPPGATRAASTRHSPRARWTGISRPLRKRSAICWVITRCASCERAPKRRSVRASTSRTSMGWSSTTAQCRSPSSKSWSTNGSAREEDEPTYIEAFFRRISGNLPLAAAEERFPGKMKDCLRAGAKKTMNMGYSLWGILVLIGDVWAIINILQSSASNEKKLLWIIVVVLLPLLGLILWFFLGPRERKA